MELLNAGTADTPTKLMAAMLTAYNAATFGSCDDHLESAYTEPDSFWLGVEWFVDDKLWKPSARKLLTPCMVTDLAASSSKV